MRQIELMARAIAQLLFTGKNADGVLDAVCRSEADLKLEKLLSDGALCAAEDWLFDNMDASDTAWLQTALRFYETLSRMPEKELEAHDFSREEILRGLRDVCEAFGCGDLLME